MCLLALSFGEGAGADSATRIGAGAVAKPTHHHVPLDQDEEIESGPSLNPGDEIIVDRYDARTKAYSLILRADETITSLVATPEDLAKSIRKIKIADILKEPKSIEDKVFTVDKDKELRLLTPEEIAARRKR